MHVPVPSDESARLTALLDYRVLDSAPEELFDNVTQLASTLLGTPIALVSLIDGERQWFKSRVGLPLDQTAREHAFCGHAIWQTEPMIVPDATRDPRFEVNPLVTGEPHIRFYCGIPLRTPEGHGLGTLCVMDRVPRTLSAEQLDVLRRLARQVELELEIRRRLALLHEALAREQKARRQHRLLASMLVHDLRAPLTAIGLLASLVRAQDDESRQRLAALIAESERVRRMLTDVLDISLRELDGLHLRRASIDLLELMRLSAGRMELLARVRGQRIETMAEGGPFTLEADPELLERVLVNLITNAMQHGPEGQTIQLAACPRAGGGVRCEVRDSCAPIDSEQRELLFEPLRRLQSQGSHHGYGLGLAFCKLAVEAHGGEIGVEPAASGGNCFFFELPPAPVPSR